MFNKEEFIEFFELRFGQNFKQYGLKLTQHQDDPFRFDIEVTLSPEKEPYHQMVRLNNTWRNYLRTEDICVMDGLINTFEDLLNQSLSESGDTVSLEKVFPLIRNENFHKEFDADGQELYFSPLTFGIEMVYAFDSPDYVQFAYKALLPAEINADQLKEKAVENLKKQGWTKHEEYDEQECGIFRNFIEYEHLYNAQFLIPEMYEAQLGKLFFVAFPNKHITLTFKPKSVCLENEGMLLDALIQFNKLSVAVNSNMENPILSSIYQVKNDSITLIKA